MNKSPTIPTQTVIASRGPVNTLTAQEFKLLIENSSGTGTAFPLQPGDTRVGKAADNDVVLDHPTVSRYHLVIHRQGNLFLAEDLHSTNGTLIDGAQIQAGYLRAGCLLEVGDVKLHFQPEISAVEILPTEQNRLGELVGNSVPMRQIFALINQIAATESTVLLVGETGSGKGAGARTLHQLSGRNEGPLVVFDCAAVSHSLIESELFGHEKGAFTGATSLRVGCLERANGGTLFLDEIDDLSLDLQPKLLRALEDRVFHRLGASSAPISFDARVIVASKKDLWKEAEANRFRQDLYFRLSVFTVNLPPLRDRTEDIPLLVDAIAGEPLWNKLPALVREQFLGHTWPGNVRELRNALERAKHVIGPAGMPVDSLLRAFSHPASFHDDVLPVDYAATFKDSKDDLVRGFEREYLTRLLARVQGNIAKAAREADLDRKHLYSLLHKYGLAAKE